MDDSECPGAHRVVMQPIVSRSMAMPDCSGWSRAQALGRLAGVLMPAIAAFGPTSADSAARDETPVATSPDVQRRQL